jgi:hypothetical protein
MAFISMGVYRGCPDFNALFTIFAITPTEHCCRSNHGCNTGTGTGTLGGGGRKGGRADKLDEDGDGDGSCEKCGRTSNPFFSAGIGKLGGGRFCG